MSMHRNPPADKTSRKVAAAQGLLASLRLQTYLMRCQLDNPRNECRRKLLAIQLDAVDARAAHIAARLMEVAA